MNKSFYEEFVSLLTDKFPEFFESLSDFDTVSGRD